MPRARWVQGVLVLQGVLAGALGAAPVAAADDAAPDRRAGPEAAVGVLDHGVRRPFRDAAPPGVRRESEREGGTADVQFVYRAPPLRRVLGARPAFRLQLNGDGRTSFAAAGAEWRQGVLGGRLYGQIGFGLAVHDGYDHLPDAAAPGLPPAEVERRERADARRTGFGSTLLFNPSGSLGVRLGGRWAVEAAWEHFSQKRLLDRHNPGIDNLGLRLVRVLGRRGG